MYGDTANAPFYGVTSGDPLADQVIIWTKISSSAAIEKAFWELSVYPDFSWINKRDSVVVDLDFTVKVDVTGLSPSTIYYYRFKDEQGRYSATGTTRQHCCQQTLFHTCVRSGVAPVSIPASLMDTNVSVNEMISIS